MVKSESADLFLQWTDDRLLKLESDLDTVSAEETPPGQRQVDITCLYVKAGIDTLKKQKELGVEDDMLGLPPYELRVAEQRKRAQDLTERALGRSIDS